MTAIHGPGAASAHNARASRRPFTRKEENGGPITRFLVRYFLTTLPFQEIHAASHTISEALRSTPAVEEPNGGTVETMVVLSIVFTAASKLKKQVLNRNDRPQLPSAGKIVTLRQAWKNRVSVKHHVYECYPQKMPTTQGGGSTHDLCAANNRIIRKLNPVHQRADMGLCDDVHPDGILEDQVVPILEHRRGSVRPQEDTQEAVDQSGKNEAAESKGTGRLGIFRGWSPDSPRTLAGKEPPGHLGVPASSRGSISLADRCCG